MSNSTSLLTQMTGSQASKEVTFNTVCDALSPSSFWGRNAVSSSGLIWAYFGGFYYATATMILTAVANGTVTLTASTTNYVELSQAGVVSANSTAFTAGRKPLYTVVTGATTVTSWIDYRQADATQTGIIAINCAGAANVTVTQVQLRAKVIQLTGLLTGSIDLLFPAFAGTYSIQNDTTGAFTITAKVSGGTGVVVTQAKVAVVITDGTNTKGIISA